METTKVEAPKAEAPSEVENTVVDETPTAEAGDDTAVTE